MHSAQNPSHNPNKQVHTHTQLTQTSNTNTIYQITRRTERKLEPEIELATHQIREHKNEGDREILPSSSILSELEARSQRRRCLCW